MRILGVISGILGLAGIVLNINPMYDLLTGERDWDTLGTILFLVVIGGAFLLTNAFATVPYVKPEPNEDEINMLDLDVLENRSIMGDIGWPHKLAALLAFFASLGYLALCGWLIYRSVDRGSDSFLNAFFLTFLLIGAISSVSYCWRVMRNR